MCLLPITLKIILKLKTDSLERSAMRRCLWTRGFRGSPSSLEKRFFQLVNDHCPEQKRRTKRFAFCYSSQFLTWLSVINTPFNLRSCRCLGTNRSGYGRRIHCRHGLPLASTSKTLLLVMGSSLIRENKGDPTHLLLGPLVYVVR